MDINIKERVENTAAIFAAPVFGAWVVATGITNTALSILKGGTDHNLNYKAEKLMDIHQVFPLMLQGLMGVINPKRGVKKFNGKNYGASGIFTKNLSDTFFAFACEKAYESSFFKKHIVSRISFALVAVLAIATRTADLALGILATPFAIVSYGFFGKNDYAFLKEAKNVRDFAMQQLTFCGLISDICFSLRGIVNPQQFV